MDEAEGGRGQEKIGNEEEETEEQNKGVNRSEDQTETKGNASINNRKKLKPEKVHPNE